MVLGAQLRRLRMAAGVTRGAAGYEIRCSHTKISRMELGQVSFKQRDVADLLTLYGVHDAAERDSLLTLAAQADSRGWWHGFADLMPGWFEVYVGLEEAASVIRCYEAQFVPGLLQSEDYARAVIRAGYPLAAPDEVERRVRAPDEPRAAGAPARAASDLGGHRRGRGTPPARRRGGHAGPARTPAGAVPPAARHRPGRALRPRRPRGAPAPQIDSGVPHSARIWNYWLGGKDNYPADREAGDQVPRNLPGHHRRRPRRRQFLPGRAVPGRRRRDPPVPRHRHRPAHRAQHPRDRPGRSRRSPGSSTWTTTRWCWPTPGRCSSAPRRRHRLHRGRPRRPRGDPAPGRQDPGPDAAGGDRADGHPGAHRRTGAVPYHLRGPEQIAAYFDGLELVEPGLVSCPLWRPDTMDVGTPVELAVLGAIGRKP
jgi:hypothetical protein